MKYRFQITGLDCPNCAAKLAKMIEGKEGISSAKINFLTERLTVESELTSQEALNLSLAAARAFDKNVKIEQ